MSLLPRRREVAPNGTVEAVPVYGTDPHGAAMFHGILNGTLGSLGARPVIDADRAPWHGWTQAPQGFRGALGVGGGRPVVSPVTTIDQERGTSVAPDVIQQIFESRAAAGRFE